MSEEQVQHCRDCIHSRDLNCVHVAEAARHKDLRCVYYLPKNPTVREILESWLREHEYDGLCCEEPGEINWCN